MLHAAVLTFLVAVGGSDDLALATKLAQAIASQHGDAPAQVFIGKYPPGGAPHVPLPKLPLLGSVMQSSDGMGYTTTIYYEIPRTNDSALESYKGELQRDGWRAARTNADTDEGNEGGFAVARHAAPDWNMYCKRDVGVVALGHISPVPDVMVVATYSSSLAPMMCAMVEAVANMPQPLELPLLKAPANVAMHDGGGSVPENTSYATLSMSRPLAEVGSDFAKQFSAAGWLPQPPAHGESAYVQTFTRRKNGHRYLATLTIVTAGKPNRYRAYVTDRDIDAKEYENNSIWVHADP